MIMNDEVEQEFSKILLSFFILSSIADKKENINQYMDTVSLHPVDLSQAEVRKLRENFLDLEPQNLINFSKKRNVGRNCMFFALKHIIKVFNLNLLRKANGSIANMKLNLMSDGLERVKLKLSLEDLKQLTNFFNINSILIT